MTFNDIFGGLLRHHQPEEPIPSVDAYIEHRNRIQLRAEAKGEAAARLCWAKLGVANRHIMRVLKGEMALTDGVRGEIEGCLARATEGKEHQP